MFICYRYLRTLHKYREEGRQIVYTVYCADCSRYIPSGKGPRLICCDAGSAERGFIDGAGIVFQSKTKSEDYHDEMNVE